MQDAARVSLAVELCVHLITVGADSCAGHSVMDALSNGNECTSGMECTGTSIHAALALGAVCQDNLAACETFRCCKGLEIIVAGVKGGPEKRGEAMRRACAGVLHVTVSSDAAEWRLQEQIWRNGGATQSLLRLLRRSGPQCKIDVSPSPHNHISVQD